MNVKYVITKINSNGHGGGCSSGVKAEKYGLCERDGVFTTKTGGKKSEG